MCTASHLEPLRAAGHGGEDVVGVHGAQDEVAARPRLQAAAAEDGVSGPCLEAAHADGGEVVHLALVLDLHAALVVLPRRQEEGPVHQGVPVMIQRMPGL